MLHNISELERCRRSSSCTAEAFREALHACETYRPNVWTPSPDYRVALWARCLASDIVFDTFSSIKRFGMVPTCLVDEFIDAGILSQGSCYMVLVSLVLVLD